MKIVKTTWFPFGDYDAIAVWPFIFTKGDVDDFIINHEKIHCEQQKELFLVGFYALYSATFLYEFLKSVVSKEKKSIAKHWDTAYYNNPFEREAYDNQNDMKYFENRKAFSWIKYNQ